MNGAVGIYLVHTLPLVEVSEAGLVKGIVQLMGVLGLLFIVATQTKINTANFYIGSTNFESFFSRAFGLNLPRTVWVFFVGVVSFVAMIMNIFSFINTWLAYQGTILVAWVGIALVFIVVRRRAGIGAFEFRPGRVPDFNPGGLISWIVSSGVGSYLLASASPIASTWALVITLALSVLLSSASLLVSSDRWFALSRPHDPRDEVADVWNDRIRCDTCRKSYVAVEMDRDPSGGHQPICASCATGHSLSAAALAESTN